MASSYDNDLRLNEMGTGDASGSWGTNTNANLTLIGEALGFGTEAITTNADAHTSTIADGGTDPIRAIFIKYTGTLDSACTITIGPNTVNKFCFIHNATSGSQSIIISQGSGANVTIATGQTKGVYLDGAGSGAAVVDAFATLSVVDLLVDDDLTVTDDASVGGDLLVSGEVQTANIGFTDGDNAMVIADGGAVTFSIASVFTGGFQSNGAINVGVDDTGYDVKFFGATASAYMQWDASQDDLILGGAARLGIGTASPASDLHLKSSTSGDPELRIEGSGTDNGIITFLGVGHSNPAVAMRYISTGDSVGHLAFYANASSSSTLSERFRISSDGSLSTPTAGDNNVRFGVNAGNSILDGGNYNVTVGDEAGTTITTGDHNVAVGYNSGASISTGGENTLLGDATGDALDVGTQNVAVGYLALSADTKGSTSTAVGVAALTTQNFTSATNSYNTAVGYDTGGSVTTGKENTLIGGLCGDALTTGSYNTLLGKEAGSYTVNLITGGDNVLIGAYCHTTATDTTRAMVLGYNVQGTTDYTTIGYGTSDIRAAHGNVTWATVSDERYKKDIVDSTAGLSFINALQPRTFKYKTLGELPETFRAYVSPDDEEKDSTEVFKNSKTNHGFIAQEVKAAIDADSSIKDGFRLWDDRDDGSQEVAEAALIPILVKAVQELSTALDAALARITELEG